MYTSSACECHKRRIFVYKRTKTKGEAWTAWASDYEKPHRNQQCSRPLRENATLHSKTRFQTMTHPKKQRACAPLPGNPRCTRFWSFSRIFKLRLKANFPPKARFPELISLTVPPCLWWRHLMARHRRARESKSLRAGSRINSMGG